MLCSRYYICNYGNQTPVGIKTRGIAEDGYYLATSLEDAKSVSNSNYFMIYRVVTHLCQCVTGRSLVHTFNISTFRR